MKRSIHLALVWWALLCLGLLSYAHAQSYVTEAGSGGFTLKKVVSDTLIATGQNFSYTVYFSIPAGATGVTITDALPPALTYQAISVTSACGAPTVTTPAVGANGTVSLSWGTVPTGCSGSFVVTVQFPNGITCPGTAARNNVCMTALLGGAPIDFCTGYISTTATASDPWNIGKWVIGAGTQPGPCTKVTADSIVTYQICVYKNVGTTGQLNMESAVVYDTLPPGAMLVNSTCGATQTGNVVTWNIGSLSALPMYNTVCCTYSVLYPPALFPTGTQLLNQATLQGTLGSGNSPCGPALHVSNQTCVEIKTITSGTISKYVYTNGQPGCTGKYSIWICNNGSVPITSMTVTDTIPFPLTGLSIGGSSASVSATLAGNIVTATLTSPLAPTACVYFEVNFTIPNFATVGSVVTNCAQATIVGTAPLSACASFTVAAPAPKPCVRKEVCNKQPSYSPGDVFRYRLRVQNIGGLPITAATITDVLDPNLEYVGSPSYYTASAWNVPCQTTSNWSGVTLSQAGNTLTFTLPTIPATCQNIFYGSCGMYGTPGVPYYFIEFDVKVSDTTALGNIPNSFDIAGGNLTGTTSSNIEYVNVVGTAGFSLDKGVASDTTSWASTLSTTAGANVNYRLRLTVSPGSVGLRHVTFADLLPRDNPPGDNLILGPCTPRGSAFNLGFSAPVSSVPAAADYKNATSFSNVNIFTPSGAPAPMFTSGCGTMGTWVPGIAPLDRNLGWYFGSAPLGAGSTATTVFTATVAPGAPDSAVACNTFAANAAVRHLINSAVYTDQVTGNLESGTACVTVTADTTGQKDCFNVKPQSILSTGVDAVGNCTYDIVVSISNPGPATMGYFESFSGTVSPSPIPIPTGTSTDTLTFVDLPPADSFICIRYGIDDATGVRRLCDSLCIDLPPCGGTDPCDSLSVKVSAVTSSGVDATGNCNYTVALSVTNASSSPIPMWFDSFEGTVVPGGLTVPSGPSIQTLTFTDTPPGDTFVCIRYGTFQGVQPQQRVLCDSVCFDIEPCGDTKPCDSLIKAELDTVCCEYSATIFNGPGTPITSISYYVTGGTVADLSTSPCPPVAPAPAGSTSGVLNFSPPCAGNIMFSFQGNPTTASNTIFVTLVVHHGQDSCTIRFEYTCDRTPLQHCDEIKVKPFITAGLALSGRTFKILNTKVPASPITHIDVTPIPTPCSVVGGGLKVDYVPTVWPAPYTRIPTSGFISANLAVSFNLAINYSCNWTGNVQIVVHHADGDSCLFTYGPWKAKLGVGTGVVLTDPIKGRVYAKKLRLQNPSGSEPVKWISVSVESASDVIVAGSGQHWEGTALSPGYEALEGYEQGATDALFTFETAVPAGGSSGDFNLVVARDSASSGTPVVRWTTYDADGNALATDTVGISGTVLTIRGSGSMSLSSDFELLQSFPNPAAHSATINYALKRAMAVQLELFNQLGERVAQIDPGFETSGLHSAHLDMSGLAPGTYFVRLSGDTGAVTKPLIIAR